MKCVITWGISKQPFNGRERIYERNRGKRKNLPSLPRVTITESDYDESGTKQNIERAKAGRKED